MSPDILFPNVFLFQPISELQIPDGITEGTEVELGAISTDAEFGGQRAILKMTFDSAL